MERMLFRPFRIEAWLVLGFASFLSDYLSGQAGGHYSGRWRGGPMPSAIVHGISAFLLHPVLSGIILAVLTIVLIAFVVLQWVSCRGRFIFLHNAATERAGIVEPWRRFARQGNSLFVWSLLFSLVAIGIAVLITLPFLAALVALWADGQFHWTGLGALVGFLAMIVPYGLLVGLTILFLNHFVVPIMYRQGVGAGRAWSLFLKLLLEHPGAFVIYGVLMLVMGCLVAGVVFTVGIGTCCIGFLLIGTPYVGQVVTLPIHLLFRGYGPHFLAQFGPDFDAFAGAAPSAVTPAPGGAA
jgi:hypothetical protein